MSSFREIWSYRFMLWSLIQSDLRGKYKGSALGFLWTFANPLLMLIIYSLVFSTVMRINIKNYSVFIFIGLLAWNMFAVAVQTSARVIISNSSLVKKTYFPRHILPLSVVGSSLINFLFTLIILIPTLIIFGYEPNWYWCWFPVILVFQVLFTVGLAMLFSSLDVWVRDLEHFIGVALQLLFYLTPIIYSLQQVPSKYIFLFKLNPISSFIVSYQDIFYYEQPVRWKLFLYGAFVSVCVLALGWTVFNRLSNRFAEEV